LVFHLGVAERHNTLEFVNPAAELIAFLSCFQTQGYELRSWFDKSRGIMSLYNPKAVYAARKRSRNPKLLVTLCDRIFAPLLNQPVSAHLLTTTSRSGKSNFCMLGVLLNAHLKWK